MDRGECESLGIPPQQPNDANSFPDRPMQKKEI